MMGVVGTATMSPFGILPPRHTVYSEHKKGAEAPFLFANIRR